MKKLRTIGKTFVFLSLLLVLLSVSQKIFTHKFKYPTDHEDHLGRYREFLQLDDNSIDVLFLGTSHTMYAVSPMEIYENTGIVSYNLSGSAHRMSNSKVMLDLALRTQSPKVVLLDASSLFQEDENFSAWRKTLDSLPFSLAKVGYAREYATAYTGVSISEASSLADMVDAVNQKLKAAVSIVFPMYFYHADWSSLNSYDFTAKNTATYTKGYFLSAVEKDMTTSVETMNVIAEQLFSPQEVCIESYENGASTSAVTDKVHRKDTISEKCLTILLDMKKLCEEHGAKLILMKIPSAKNPQTYVPSWTWQRSQTVKSMADSYGFTFYDIQYDSDWEWQTNYSMDGGGHCNYYGARAVSDKLGEYLKEVCGIQAKEDVYYDNGRESYKKITALADLKLTEDLNEYFIKLVENKDRYGIALAVNGDMVSILNDDTRWLLAELGLRTMFSSSKAGWSYVAMLDGGELKVEATGNQTIKRNYTFENGTKVELRSVGKTTLEAEEPSNSIIVDDTEYAGEGSGLSVVVYDLEIGCVIDQRRFYGSDESNVKSIETKVNTLMINYEHEIFERKKGF